MWKHKTIKHILTAVEGLSLQHSTIKTRKKMQMSPGAENRSQLLRCLSRKQSMNVASPSRMDSLKLSEAVRRPGSHLPTQTRCCCLTACRCRPGPARRFRPAHRRGGSHRCGPASDWCLELQASSLPSFPGCLDILTKADGRTLAVSLLLC